MKIAFISDIHSNLEALKSILKEIDKMNVNSIFCVGDVIGYSSSPNECLSVIKKRKIPSVIGNHEWGVINHDTSWFNAYASQAIWWTIDKIKKSNLKFIKNFPEKIELELNDRKMLIVHGSPKDPIWEYVYILDIDENFIKNLDYDVVVMGHTHVPFIKKIENKLIINSGSVGQPRDGDSRACFIILDLEKLEAEIVRVEYDVKKAIRKIIKAGLPEFLAMRLYSGI